MENPGPLISRKCSKSTSHNACKNCVKSNCSTDLFVQPFICTDDIYIVDKLLIEYNFIFIYAN